MQIDERMLGLSPEEGARLLALGLVADADRAGERLEKGTDDEALHDFRVALRRLRSVLRAFRTWLKPSVKRRHERRLSEIAGSTNEARDAEVQLVWLRAQREALASPRHQAGYELVVSRFEGRTHAGPEAARVVERYRRVADKVRRRLRRHQHTPHRGSTSLGSVLAMLLRDQVGALRQAVEAIGGPSDQQTVHRARIEGKRLRYLLEPLRGHEGADASAPIKHLKEVQDLLGDLNDSHVLAAELRETLVEAAAELARAQHASIYGADAGSAALAANPRPGVLALARHLRGRRDVLHASVLREWREGGLDVLAAEVAAVASALEAGAAVALRRERRYLLTSLPPRAAQADLAEIAEGWLPGKRLHERVRRERRDEGDRFFRAVREGEGPETEEETTPALFRALWPLTDERRVIKRRHRVVDGALHWEIDEFLDRPLVLAAVGLPAHAAEVELPAWLGPLVVREVTEDVAFRDEDLAQSHAESSCERSDEFETLTSCRDREVSLRAPT